MTIENWLAILAAIGTVVAVLLFAVLKYVISTQERHSRELSDHSSRISVAEYALKITDK